MAVQKNKCSRSRRGKRRSNNRLKKPVLFVNKKNNNMNYYHHISKDGFYRDKLIKNFLCKK